MIKAYKEYWKNLLVMDGTATRAQYWWPQVLNYLILLLFSLLIGMTGGVSIDRFDYSGLLVAVASLWGTIWVLLSFCIWLANFTVRARRLHDTNRSNWWILLYCLPFFGSIILFIFLILPSSPYSRWKTNQTYFY